MFHRPGRSPPKRFTRQQTRQWLAWLAQSLTRHNQTVFYLEWMQPDWLPRGRERLVGLGARLVSGLVSGLVGGLFWGLVGWLVGWLVFGLLWGLYGGLLGFLTEGGFVCLQHFILRLLLWWHGFAPLHYIRFLDYAAERILLRKVGGGYIFVHRLLMEHFAGLELPSGKSELA